MNKVAIVFLVLVVGIVGYKLYQNYQTKHPASGATTDLTIFDIDVKILEAQNKRADPPIQPPTNLGTYKGHPVEQIYTCFNLECPSGGNYLVEYSDVHDEQTCDDLGGKPVFNQDPTPLYEGCAVGK